MCRASTPPACAVNCPRLSPCNVSSHHDAGTQQQHTTRSRKTMTTSTSPSPPASACHTAMSPEARPTHKHAGSDNDWLQPAVSKRAQSQFLYIHIYVYIHMYIHICIYSGRISISPALNRVDDIIALAHARVRAERQAIHLRHEAVPQSNVGNCRLATEAAAARLVLQRVQLPHGCERQRPCATCKAAAVGNGG